VFGDGWVSARPVAFPERSRWTWVLRTPLPFVSPDLFVPDFTAAFGSHAVGPNLALVGSRLLPVAYGDAGAASTEDRFVTANSKHLVWCDSPAEAALCAANVKAVSAAADRTAAVRELVNRAFAGNPGERLTMLQKAIARVRIASGTLWLVSLVAFPLVLLWSDSTLAVLRMLVVLWSGSAMVAVVAARTAGKLPADMRPSRWMFFKCALYPVAALWVTHDLIDGAWVGFHPSAMVREFCSSDDRIRTAREILLRTKYPVSPGGAVESMTATLEFCAAVTPIMEQYLLAKLPEISKSLVPAKQSKSVVLWCPRCLAQYSATQEQCADCPGIALRPFSGSKR
jgi:hypothetical protein